MSLSRVEKYAELRKRIDNMVSTFDDPITDNKIPDVQMDEPKVKEEAMTKEEVQEAHIKKNTLSISIDELIKQHEEYTQTISKSEIENQMKTQKKEHNFTRLLFIILLIVVIIVAVFVGLLLGGSNEMSFSIAIDGPAAAGKSTVAKQVAKILNCVYIDTGAMYRAITWYALSKGVDPKDEEKVTALLPEIDLSLHLDGKVVVNDQDITKEIRTTEVADNVSYIASYKKIRLHLVELQRKMSKNVSVVMDGRDIGSYVLPYADVKIFQVASVETRAVRRYKENLEKGINCSIEEIEENLRKRDYIDSHREFAPLKKAEDSFVLDTSNMTIDEAVNAIIKIVKNKLGEVK